MWIYWIILDTTSFVFRTLLKDYTSETALFMSHILYREGYFSEGEFVYNRCQPQRNGKSPDYEFFMDNVHTNG